MQNPQLFNLLLPIALFALLWFLMIRPQQVQAKKRQEMLNSLRKGDRVITIGGIHGTILDLDPETITLRVADGVDITVQRSAIGAVRGAQKDDKSGENA
ncbi:preprotein translocase subunit YajC [Caldinitratiruptor microaerophilus]|uniref:Preprotein translocase subunit YajC n=1 Tax=Caldinitratiruptor microaerophilus TaxID=671077 RepID=A0AA35CKB4_9FIRM|nr:preprotein translocase subunit YajC [Caldinitratiruptor microaerophilus]BDG60797.1 hypothetical protein caldi_18870 [Caldinitratiruptor microaerophilus]